MSILDYFRPKKTAKVAKDRLQIIIAQERSKMSQQEDYLPLMRQDILAVIKKYTGVTLDDVKVDLQCNANNSILELNITLPDHAAIEEAAKKAKQAEKASAEV